MRAACCAAYAPVLLERKAERIRKSMTPEKAESVVVRTVFQGADRQYVTFILTRSTDR